MPSERIAAVTTRAEHHLLLQLARIRPVTAQEDVRRLTADSAFDWNYFIQVASLHGVLILVYAQLRRVIPAALAPSVRASIQRMATQTALHNLELTKELAQLHTLLTKDGLDLLTYKGPSLATIAYGGVGLRQFSDLDLMVRPRDLLRAKQMILDYGYYAVSSPEHQQYQKEDHDRSYQGYDLVRADQTVMIDLQERFGLRFSSFTLDFDELWTRRQPFKVGDRYVATLSREDYLLVLCAHGTQHRWQRLKWVCDIAELIATSPDMEWETIFARAEAMRTTRMLAVGLLLAHETCDIDLPSHVMTRVQSDATACRLVMQAYTWMFRDADSFGKLVQRAVFDYGFDLAMREQLRNKIACALFLSRRRLFPRVHEDGHES